LRRAAESPEFRKNRIVAVAGRHHIAAMTTHHVIFETALGFAGLVARTARSHPGALSTATRVSMSSLRVRGKGSNGTLDHWFE